MESVKPRSYGLDALRGLAILGMALSGMIPWGTLPPWMYHAQLPPPKHQLDLSISGLTWVDLVFPFFLFAMGAAVPLARPQSILRVVGRFLSLAAFAIVVQSLRTFTITGKPDASDWWLSIGTFALMVLAWGRWPSPAPKVGKRQLPLGPVLNISGVLGLVAILITTRYADGSGFDLKRSDPILLSLANCALVLGMLWHLARTKPWVWCMVWGAIALMFISRDLSVGKMIWNWSPANWLISWDYLKWSLVAIPGMAATLHFRRHEDPSRRPLAIPVVVSFFTLWAGLAVEGPLRSALIALAVSIAVVEWLRWPAHIAGRFAVMVGAILAMTIGAVRKDTATLAYLVGTPFAAALALSMADASRVDRPGYLVLVGMNPMLGYITITHLVPALIRLTGLHGWVGEQGWSPWTLACYGLAQTLVVAAVCVVASRKRFFLRT